MKNRNKIIAIFFVVFILVIPAVTFVRGFTSKPEQSGLTAEQQAILEGNGTLQKTDDNKENEVESESEVVEEDSQSEYVQDLNFFDAFAYRFVKLKDSLSQFTNRLFLKTKFVAFNAKLTSFFTNGEYVESNTALAGKDGWVFYKQHEDGQPLWNYMGINNFTEEELEKGAANLVETRDELAKRGIDFVAVCLPNKEIVYSEYMPDTVVQVNPVTKGLQFANYMWENTDVKYLYPLDELLAAKDDVPEIYFKTDTHWNQYGAFVGYSEVLKTNYGQSDSPESVEFKLVPENKLGDIVYNAGISDKYPLNDDYVFVKTSAHPENYHDEKLLIVGDSFSGFFETFSPAYFSDVKRVEIQSFTWDVIDEYKPDFVIWEQVERYNTRFVEAALTQR